MSRSFRSTLKAKPNLGKEDNKWKKQSNRFIRRKEKLILSDYHEGSIFPEKEDFGENRRFILESKKCYFGEKFSDDFRKKALRK